MAWPDPLPDGPVITHTLTLPRLVLAGLSVGGWSVVFVAYGANTIRRRKNVFISQVSAMNDRPGRQPNPAYHGHTQPLAKPASHRTTGGRQISKPTEERSLTSVPACLAACRMWRPVLLLLRPCAA